MCITSFRTAHQSDVDAIVRLVNAAYRPESVATGWTHETHLIAGDRINSAQLGAMLAKPDSAVLVGLKNSEIVASVHIQKDGSVCRIGMLAVKPSLQGLGLGNQMLGFAESYASEVFNSKQFKMLVLSDRHELMAFYLRHGYQKTGEIIDYPLSAGAGTPKLAGLTLDVLVKQEA